MAWRVQPLKIFLMLLALVIFVTDPADAARKRKRHRAVQPKIVDLTPLRNRDAAIVIEASSGNVLYERYSDELRYPASLTKMMTLYLLFEALQKGTVSLSTPMTASAYAASQDPTKLGLDAGDSLTVEEAIKALVVRSANDAAVVVAENLAGSEQAFAQRMTTKARELGMTRTSFMNASGLPDDAQETTARDLVALSRHLISDFPQFYPYFRTQSLVWNGRTYEGHNALLKFFDGADGLKTGYTRLSGYNLATSATRRGLRLIAVIMGGRSARDRDMRMADMLEGEFNKLGLGRPAPVVIAMSPLVPDDDEATAVEQTERAAESKPVQPQPASPAQGEPPAPVYAGITPRYDPGEGDVETEEKRRAARTNWGIQVGAYSDRQQAEEQLNAVRTKAHDLIGEAKGAIVTLDVRGEVFYRVRFGAFPPAKAEDLCNQLQRRGVSCLTVTDGSWDQASSRAALPLALR